MKFAVLLHVGVFNLITQSDSIFQIMVWWFNTKVSLHHRGSTGKQVSQNIKKRIYKPKIAYIYKSQLFLGPNLAYKSMLSLFSGELQLSSVTECVCLIV